MMKSRSILKITAYPKTPVAIGNTSLSLDAVLYGVMQDSIDEPIGLQDIPLRSADGLFFASKAYFRNPILSQEMKIGGVRPQKDQGYFDAVEPSSLKVKIDNKRGKFKSSLSRYRCVSSDGVFWLAEGDARRVETILKRTRSIGALRKEGYGLVGGFEIEEIAQIDVLLDESGEVRRPIPVRLAHLCASAPLGPTAMETWRPPYWDRAGLEECHVPRPEW